MLELLLVLHYALFTVLVLANRPMGLNLI